MKFGALEAGGTKMVLAIYDEQGTKIDSLVLPTLEPDKTMPPMIDFFKAADIAALGIGTFGPVCLDESSPDYGAILETPKLAWRHYPMAKTFANALNIPIKVDTDVNGAALAEHTLGAGKGLNSCLYVTVGTGIGGGLVIGGELVHGLSHPELGHMLLAPLDQDPLKQGVCPYHKGCLEGLAAGPSIQKRYGIPAQDLPDDHIAFRQEATYLAQMCINAMMSFSPEKIILGGGVMQKKCMFPMIHDSFKALNNGYITHPSAVHPETYIVPPALDTASGSIGAFLLAQMAYKMFHEEQ